MKIEDKLYEMWCPRDIEGKTVSKVYDDRYDPIVAFTDGAYFCRHDPQELMENYQYEINEDAEYHPLVLVDVLTADEVDMYWEEREQESKERSKTHRRRVYEELKEEFENEND